MKLITFNGEKDSKKLKTLPFNRDFGVVKSLIESMKLNGFTVPLNLIKTDLITGKTEIYIADGQHRAMTAQFLDIPYYGILVEKTFSTVEEIVKYVATLNSTQREWQPKDYIDAYAYLGKDEYKRLLWIKEKSSYSLTCVASMLYGVRSRGTIKERIQSGDFKCNYTKHTEYVLKLAGLLSKTKRPNQREILSICYISATKVFNEKNFIKMYEMHINNTPDMELNDTLDLFTQWCK